MLTDADVCLPSGGAGCVRHTADGVRGRNGQEGTHFTCFTGTKVQILTPEECVAPTDFLTQLSPSLYLLYWYKSTCFTGTTVQILTPEERPAP